MIEQNKRGHSFKNRTWYKNDTRNYQSEDCNLLAKHTNPGASNQTYLLLLLEHEKKHI